MGLIIASNSKKWILKRVCNFQMWVKRSKKQIQIFGKDFSVKNSKKSFFFFFEKKKCFFDFFLIHIFSWKTDKLNPKLDKECLNAVKKTFLTHCFILCRFMTHKWVKKLKSILVTFYCYGVSYLDNCLTCIASVLLFVPRGVCHCVPY